MALANRLRERREQLGLKQSDVALLLGITPGAVGNYENGISTPKADVLFKVFDALKCDANYLFQDEMKDGVYKDISTPEEFEKIIKKYRTLDLPGQEHVDAVLKWEMERMEQLKQTKSPTSNPPIRLIQYYQRLASAGSGQYIFDDVPSEQIEIPDILKYKKVRYALGVNGHSMEPDYLDGEIVLVEPIEDIEIGEIGIFISEGDAFIKKRGKDFLISLNKPEYNDIPLSSSTRCIGRVVGKLDV